jgi:catechol 2,3-dioxygenase-like lactoylglutathione lyase family enzyme
MGDPPFDVNRAHRWFAAQANNLAWDLVEAAGRSSEETDRMIQAAHAACFHWHQVGTPLNHLRAQCLLATAYAAAGLPEGAVRHAHRCLKLSGEAGNAQTEFDRATTHGCASLAFSLAGRLDEAHAEYRLALSIVFRFDDPGETATFHKLFPAPKPLPPARSTQPKLTSLAPQFLVGDLARSIAFYRTLGFAFGEPWGGFYAIGRLDGLELHLKHGRPNQSEREYRKENQHLDASIGVDGIDAFYDRCAASAVPILKPLAATAWGTKDFYIEDPDGYIICFGGRTG